MTKDIDAATHMALVATMATTLFQVLEATAERPSGARTDADRYGASGAAFALLALSIEGVWGDEPATAGAATVLGQLLIRYPAHIAKALNSLSEDLGSDLITKPKAEQLEKLQDFADSVASLESGPDTNPFLSNIIERARDVSEARPGGFKSATPLNDSFRRTRDHHKGTLAPGQSVREAIDDDYRFTADSPPGHAAPEDGEA